MKKSILLFISIIAVCGLSAQNIKVIDATSLRIIKNAVLMNESKDKLVYTDNEGKVKIDIFEFEERIYVQHPSYQHYVTTKKVLNSEKNIIKLIPSVLKLKEFVFSASKWEEDKSDIPMKIESIEPEEIRFNNPQTTADLLAQTGEVFIQKSQLGGGSPMIRGFASNKVLIVIDGIRMNNAIYRHGNLQNILSIDPNSIGKAEIIFGPGSVLYGSDAIGGVMDFHSTFLPVGSNKLIYEVNAFTRYSSVNNEKTAHVDFIISKNKWANFSSISYSNFGDLHMGENIQNDSLTKYYTYENYVEQINGKDTVIQNQDIYSQKNSGYTQINILEKVRYKASNKLDFEYSFNYSSTSDVPRFDRLRQTNNGLPKYAEWYYGPQKLMINSLNVTYKNKTKIMDKMRLIVASQNYEESRHDRKLNSDELRHRTEKVNVYSMNLDIEKQIDKKQHLFYGADAYLNFVKSSGIIENILTETTEASASRYPNNSTYNTASLYALYKNKWSEKWVFQSGFRYSYIWSHSPFDTTFYSFPFESIDINTGAPTANIGLVFKPNKSWKINSCISSGFRAPNIDDIGKVFDSEPGSVVVPNPDVKSEYAINYELGVSKQINGSLNLSSNLFYTYLFNALVREDYTFNGLDSILYDGEMSKVQAIVNTGNVQVYGANLTAKANLSKHISTIVNCTYMDGHDEDNNPWRHVSPFFGSVHLLSHFSKFKIDLYCDFSGAIKAENLSPEEHGKTYMYTVDEAYAAQQSLLAEEDQFNAEGLYSPAWLTLNLKLSYSLNEHFSLNAGAENITNQLYRTYSSGIAAPGRNFYLSLRAHL